MSVGGNVLCIYATLGSVILAGILNMAWCKSKILKPLQKPIDAGKLFVDKKRIFGANKTWKGFIGYIIFNALSLVLFGLIFNLLNWNNYSYIWQNNENQPLFNLLVGSLFGLAYAIFELPNSFIKRRLDIKPGKTADNKATRIFFVLLDQADSIFGIGIIAAIFSSINLLQYFLIVLVGVVTHIVVNIFLYLAHLRKNMF